MTTEALRFRMLCGPVLYRRFLEQGCQIMSTSQRAVGIKPKVREPPMAFPSPQVRSLRTAPLRLELAVGLV